MNTPASIDWKQVRKELSDERTKLFNRFVAEPANIRLAVTIRKSDEQILRCTEHVRQALKSAVALQPSHRRPGPVSENATP